MTVTQRDECASGPGTAHLEIVKMIFEHLNYPAPPTKGHIVYDSIYLKYPESRLEAAGGRGRGEWGGSN